MKHPVNMTKEEWRKFYPVQITNCKDCDRGVICPDWDPPDGWCRAGIQSSEQKEVKPE